MLSHDWCLHVACLIYFTQQQSALINHRLLAYYVYVGVQRVQLGNDAGAADAVVCEHHAYGGAGAAKLGEAVISACQQKVDFKLLYDLQQPIKVSMPAGTLCCCLLFTVQCGLLCSGMSHVAYLHDRLKIL